MSPLMQLTIDGREEMVSESTGFPRRARLGPRQRAVLRELGQRGSIRAVQAGRIVHEERGACGFGSRSGRYEGLGCCAYAATDGSQLLKSLGPLVVKIGGVFYLPGVDR